MSQELGVVMVETEVLPLEGVVPVFSSGEGNNAYALTDEDGEPNVTFRRIGGNDVLSMFVDFPEAFDDGTYPGTNPSILLFLL